MISCKFKVQLQLEPEFIPVAMDISLSSFFNQ
jgi:hypothetical protein